MKNKPPPDSITKTADLMRRLLAVPKQELQEEERKWKRRKARQKPDRRTKP